MRARVLALLAWAMILAPGLALGSTLNFAAVPGAEVAFDGATDTFAFIPEGSGFDFQITTVLNAADPDTVGLLGTIEGTYAIGAVATPFPGVQTAPVSGTGTFTIVDEAGIALTGDLTWHDIYTLGAVGGVNVWAQMALTGISYTGGNADLRHLVAATGGPVTASFQFGAATPLTTLLAAGGKTTSYSGTVVPEPGTLLLLGTGLVGLAALRRRTRRTA